ncbi:hypothetical protein PCANC_16438 [Puccinia coronata f. sp. avenae]|uniref:Uncharacterized protein n=1 Tax=Puccinia coronata f. sp. avenae TaxID=200324 RepID=A0A2N5UC14_9BASI|nr:hypothetical protein PCANC_16438 [Puccinia coronata f. sp. avenae]
MPVLVSKFASLSSDEAGPEWACGCFYTSSNPSFGSWLRQHILKPRMPDCPMLEGRHWIGNKMITLSLHDPLAVDICAGSDIKWL